MDKAAVGEAVGRFIKDEGLDCKQNAASWIFCCPICDKKDKLYIRKRDGAFICFVCADDGFKGRPEKALAAISGLPLRVVRDKLYGGRSVAEFEQTIEKAEFFPLCFSSKKQEVDIQLQRFPINSYPVESPRAKAGAQYLLNRGIPPEIAQEYQIRWWPTKRKVLFPVLAGPLCLGWQERMVDKSEGYLPDGTKWTLPKALTSKGLPKAQVLMFQDRLLESDHAVLCEGPVDAIKAHLCGGNVCTLGKIVSDAQIALLRDFGIKKVYIALDPDAIKEINNLRKRLYDMQLFDMRPPKGKKDIGEMSFEEVYELFKNAKEIRPTDFLYHWPR